MTREDCLKLANNLASIIDETYSVPRPKARRVELVAHYISRAIYIGWRNRFGTVDEIVGPAT